MRKEAWNPTPEQLALIKKKYATYYSPDTLTKSRLAQLFKTTAIQFERFCDRNKIKPKKPKVGVSRDFSAYQRVPVPSKHGKETIILVPPDRCPIEAKKRYMKKFNAETQIQNQL